MVWDNPVWLFRSSENRPIASIGASLTSPCSFAQGWFTGPQLLCDNIQDTQISGQANYTHGYCN